MVEGLVSTIIPVYNRIAMLRTAVASVIAQTWRPVEIVIVDDGSTDGTLAAARELAALHPGIVRVVAQANAGPGAARQAGVDVALGEFIQFLDSDDLLLPEKFSLQVAALRGDPAAGIAYGKTYANDNGVRGAQPVQRSAQSLRTIFPALLTGRLWDTSTPLYRRAALERIGPWPRRRQMEDWEFDAQAGAAGIELHHCDAWVSETVMHDSHRLAHAWLEDDAAFADMVEAHLAMLRHARTAGVAVESDGMRSFSRTLFRMARLAAGRGDRSLAQRALEAAALAAEPGGRTAWELRAYRTASNVFGWHNIGRLCT